MGWLRARFLTGILVALPLVVTLFFARFLFNLFDRWSHPITRQLIGYPVYGVGAGVAIVLVFLLGMLAHNVLGRRILRFGEHLIGRVPVLRSIYLGTREVTRAFGSNHTKSFRRPVLIPFPVQGSWSVGFLTTEFEIDTPDGPQRMVSVFMPTTPNPTTGFYLMYPIEMIKETGMDTDAAIRMVISGGILAPHPRQIMQGTARIAAHLTDEPNTKS